MAQPIIKMIFRKEIKTKYKYEKTKLGVAQIKLTNIEYYDHIELLECGHQNNLLLSNRISGICPKGDTKDNKGKITYAEVL